MSISKETKSTLNGILIVTGIFSFIYYAFYVSVCYALLGGGIGMNYLLSFSNLYEFSFLTLGIVMPVILLIFGYGVQLTLVFLKPNKRRFIFSVISYSLIICTFIGIVLIFLLDDSPDWSTIDLIEFLGIETFSFAHLLFFLVIVVNFILAIFLTHIKVQEEEKELSPKYKNLLENKYTMASFIVVLSLSFLILVYFLNAPYTKILDLFENLFYKVFPKFVDEEKPSAISFIAGFFILSRLMFIVGIIFQIISIIDKNKQKLGLTGIIFQLIYLSILVIIYTLAVTQKSEDKIDKLFKIINIMGIIAFVLVSLTAVTNAVLYFLERKFKNKINNIEEKQEELQSNV